MTTPKWWGDRPVSEFTFPEGLRALSRCERVSLVPLEWQEEERASKLAGADLTKLGNLVTRYSIAEIDGVPVEQDGEDVQKLYNSHPMVRRLLTFARAKVCEPSDEDEAAFLGSVAVSV